MAYKISMMSHTYCDSRTHLHVIYVYLHVPYCMYHHTCMLSCCMHVIYITLFPMHYYILAGSGKAATGIAPEKKTAVPEKKTTNPDKKIGGKEDRVLPESATTATPNGMM